MTVDNDYGFIGDTVKQSATIYEQKLVSGAVRGSNLTSYYKMLNHTTAETSA